MFVFGQWYEVQNITLPVVAVFLIPKPQSVLVAFYRRLRSQDTNLSLQCDVFWCQASDSTRCSPRGRKHAPAPRGAMIIPILLSSSLQVDSELKGGETLYEHQHSVKKKRVSESDHQRLHFRNVKSHI